MNKLLIVEDDLIVRNVYRNKFAHQGFQVEVAPDGRTGWNLVQSFRPDALLLDLMLPDMPGVELLKQIRATEDLKNMPVVVLSNTYLTSVVQEAWKAGASKCLAKASCTPKQVLDAICSCLEGITPATGAVRPQTTTPAPRLHAETSLADAGLRPVPDFELQQELRQKFVESLPEKLRELRQCMQRAAKSERGAARINVLRETQRHMQNLTLISGISGLYAIANLASATDALLNALCDRPGNFNASTLRTLASAVDSIGVLINDSASAGGGQLLAASVLVVDDEPISLRAVANSLTKVNLKPVKVRTAETAIALLEENSFDLVFLDVDMPGMNGFELCTRLRSLPGNSKTPVVFVTGLSDFESRANSTISGGNDLIAKPFLSMELAVKALCYVLHARRKKTVHEERAAAPPDAPTHGQSPALRS
jgi:DNA-binding response OmpR family regulator